MAIPGFLNEILLRILPEFQVIAKGLYSNFCRDTACPVATISQDSRIKKQYSRLRFSPFEEYFES